MTTVKVLIAISPVGSIFQFNTLRSLKAIGWQGMPGIGGESEQQNPQAGVIQTAGCWLLAAGFWVLGAGSTGGFENLSHRRTFCFLLHGFYLPSCH